MTWTKLSDDFCDNPGLLQLERGVRLLFVEGLVWSNRHSTDGDLPRFALAKITDEPDAELAAKRLVEAHLWADTADGWRIVDFLEQQPSRAAVEKERKLKAERQRRWRESKGASTDASRNGLRDASKDGSPPRPAPPRKKGRAGRSGEACEAPADAPRAGFSFAFNRAEADGQ